MGRRRHVSDDPFYKPSRTPNPRRQPNPGELLFEFVRASDRAPMSCELHFHGESYGWEVQFLERGELRYSHGPFVLRELAAHWADEQRKAMEKAGSDAR